MTDNDTSYQMPARADGWTPVFDEIVKDEDLGNTAALVFGVIYRHAQMRRHVCDASQETLGELVGVSDRTVRTWAPRLVNKGYLRVVNDRPGFPITYIPTGKVALDVSVTAKSQLSTTPERGSEVGELTPESISGVPRKEDPTRKPCRKQTMHGGGDGQSVDKSLLETLHLLGFEDPGATKLTSDLQGSYPVEWVLEWQPWLDDPPGWVRNKHGYAAEKMRVGVRAPTLLRKQGTMVSCSGCHRLVHQDDLCPDCGRCYYHCHDEEGECLPG